MIYLDNAATRAMSIPAVNELARVAKSWQGNPSSVHAEGAGTKEKLERARHLVAEIFGADADDVFFTSGGTEADNIAINSLASTGALLSKRHIITTPIEHHAVLNPIKELQETAGLSRSQAECRLAITETIPMMCKPKRRVSNEAKEYILRRRLRPPSFHD